MTNDPDSTDPATDHVGAPAAEQSADLSTQLPTGIPSVEPRAETSIGAVAQAWAESLADHGYEHHVEGPDDLDHWRRAPRAWRDILRHTGVIAPARVLEAGCGGGKQLAFLALNGFQVTGVDASPAVLARARRFVRELEQASGTTLPIQIAHADFLTFAPPAGPSPSTATSSIVTSPTDDHATDRDDRNDRDASATASERHRSATPSERGDEILFDLVFNFGVVEHFLDDDERAQFMRRQIEWCRPGGHSVHVVPSGIHPARARVRAEGIGGYRVPEVDFTPESLRAELQDAGGAQVQILPANIMGHVRMLPGSTLTTAARKSVWLAAQALPRRAWSPLLGRAATFIAISRRPP